MRDVIKSARIKKLSLTLFHWILIPLIATCGALWPTLSSGLERLQFDAGDTLLNLYFLEHAYKHFSSGQILRPDQYWSPDFFWPIRNTLAWSDHLLGQSVIYSLFRLLLDPYQSYVGWLALTLWLNYAAIRHACLRISKDTKSIWLTLAALATSFSPTIIQQLGHPQLLSIFLIGPILLMCHRLVNDPPEKFCIRDWLILSSWLLANGFFNIYIFVYASFGTAVCAVIHAIKRIITGCRTISLGANLTGCIAALGGCIALDLAIYIPYMNTLATFGRRPVDEILTNLPKPISWIFGSSQWLLNPPFTPDNINPNWISGAEQELFPGWGLVVLLTATFLTATWKLKGKDCALNIWLAILVVMILCTISISKFSLWLFIVKILPGASSLRASSRVAMVIVLYAAPSIAIAARRWKAKINYPWEITGSFLATIGALASIWSTDPPSFSLARWKEEKQALSNAISTSNCTLFWYEWYDQEPWRAHVLAMHSQLQTTIPTANGYSGHFPKDNWPFTQLNGDRALAWITSSKPERFHRLKESTSSINWCIASSSQKGSELTINIRKYEPRHATKKHITWIDSPSSIIFRKSGIEIGKKFGKLYLKSHRGLFPSQWVLITRDHEGIPSKRGDYTITNAEEINQVNPPRILITDTDRKEGIEYIWAINAEDGRFLFQTMRRVASI